MLPEEEEDALNPVALSLCITVVIGSATLLCLSRFNT